MTAIEISVPSLLMDCTGGHTRFTMHAATLSETLEQLWSAYPLLRRHLYQESGKLRPHVLLFYNDDNIEWLDNLDIPLKAGDRLLVLQAVSGG